MATTPGAPPGDIRRGISSPKTRGRENTKNTLCRNLLIYGRCRYENDGCAFIHDPALLTNTQNHNEGMKKRLNVDSPSFTPLQPATNGVGPISRTATISPKAANAAVFTPKATRPVTGANLAHPRDPSSSSDWTPGKFQEFVPQTYAQSQLSDHTAPPASLPTYDPFAAPPPVSALGGTTHQPPLNPYTPDSSSLSGTAFYQNATGFAQPLQYHLYAPLGPHKENLLAYQRTVHDFFIPDNLREDLQRKSEASRQFLSSSTLPRIDHFHSLVPLDTNNPKNATLFGYPSWLYKAVSSKDGFIYALRRLEGYRLTDENAIRSVQAWKRINNGSVVTIHDVFTTRAFGDSSLVFVTDYHPVSKTLAAEHFTYSSKIQGGRPTANHIPEQVLWGYIVQIAFALKAIHTNNLAARLIHPSKIIITSKNRVRLSACAVLDVVQYDTTRSITELQQDDLVQLGRLIITLTSNNTNALHNPQKALEQLSRSYSAPLNECVSWLLSPPSNATMPQSPGSAHAASTKDIDIFLSAISPQISNVFDSALHGEDTLLSTLNRELENARLFRLVAKLGFINERPEYEQSQAWSETGERYYLKLFRDYVFHQVDANGQPVINLGHVIECLNKLDAGTDEKIQLMDWNEQNVFVVSYREIKRGLDAAWQELVKASGGRRG